MKKFKSIKIGLSIVAMAIGIIHLCYPTLQIDIITLGLFIVAALPWLAPIFKSIELPGGLKFTLQDFKEIEEKATEVGMIGLTTKDKGSKNYTFLLVAKEDPKLALAGLRIEIEDKLRQIALNNNIDMSNMGLREIMKVLSTRDLLALEEKAVLSDLIGILNSAVHSEVSEFKYTVVSKALDLGAKVLNSLDKRL